MVAKAQYNDFSIFIRKIGYSVGLENTLSRLSDFSRLYAGQENLNLGDIKRLLHTPKPDGWGLEPQNEHVLDFFKAIEVVSIRGSEVGVLELGEALGIMKKLQSESSFEQTLRYFMIHAILLADGDVMLNAMASEFDGGDFEAHLNRMIEHKWTVLEAIFKSNQQRASIYKAVTIEAQENNPGSRSNVGVRFGPLLISDSKNKAGPLSGRFDRPEIKISKNYIEKVLGRRRLWASSLGLCDEKGKLSESGNQLLDAMRGAGYAASACMTVWPLAHELETPLFSSIVWPKSMPRLSSWDFMVLIGRGIGLLSGSNSHGTKEDINEVVRVIRCFHSLNKSRGLIRNELPVRVAYRCLLSLSIGLDAVPDYPGLIKNEQFTDSPKVVARSSKLVEMALSISR